MKRATLLGIALLAVAAPVTAQEHAHERPAPGARMRMQMPMMDEMMGPMMRVMMFAPEHLLQRKDVLGLTAAQITRLTALRDAAKTAHDAAQADAKSHHDALMQVMNAGAPDTAALRQHFQAAHTAMGNAHWAMLRAAAQARALLTEGQRGRVDGWADAMQTMRHGDDDDDEPDDH